MFSLTLSSSAILSLAGLCVAALVLVAAVHRRLSVHNRRLLNAIDNMSQGLNVFDAQGRITLLNRRYIEMYNLSPAIVKPGCTLYQRVEHRKDTGLFPGDAAAYCKRILQGIAGGGSSQHYVQASDGRIVLAKNEPLPDGGWVSTHERRHRAMPGRGRTRRHQRSGETAHGHRRGDRPVPPAGRETFKTTSARRSAAARALSDGDRVKIAALAADFPALWSDPRTPDRERKRMVRLLLDDVTLARKAGGGIAVHVRFKGGQTTSIHRCGAALAAPGPAPHPGPRDRGHRHAARPAHRRRSRRHAQPGRTPVRNRTSPSPQG